MKVIRCLFFLSSLFCCSLFCMDWLREKTKNLTASLRASEYFNDVTQDDFNGVNEFIVNNPDKIDVQSLITQNTGLMIAAREGHLQIVNFLIHNRADVDLQNSDGDTALTLAVRNNNIEIVRSLLDVDVDLDQQDRDGHSALMHGVLLGHEDIVQLLINAGSNVNLSSTRDYSALMYAVIGNRLNIAQLLINNGADITQQNVNGTTALVFAINNNNTDVIRLLCRSENVDCSSFSLDLLQAVQDGDLEKVNFFIGLRGVDVNQRDDNDNSTLLINAVRNNDTKYC